MTIKTDASRSHIHDELTAPDASALIKSIQTAGGAVSKFLGVLAESPGGVARLHPTAHRSSAEQAAAGDPGAHRPRRRRGRHDPYTLTQYARTARVAGLGLDEVARARNFTSSDEKEARQGPPRDDQPSERPPHHLVEEARRRWLERRGDPRRGRGAGPGGVREPVRSQLRRCPRRAIPRSLREAAQRLARRRRHGRLDRTGPRRQGSRLAWRLLGQVPGVALLERPAVDNGRGHAQAAVVERDLRVAGSSGGRRPGWSASARSRASPWLAPEAGAVPGGRLVDRPAG